MATDSFVEKPSLAVEQSTTRRRRVIEIEWGSHSKEDPLLIGSRVVTRKKKDVKTSWKPIVAAGAVLMISMAAMLLAAQQTLPKRTKDESAQLFMDLMKREVSEKCCSHQSWQAMTFWPRRRVD